MVAIVARLELAPFTAASSSFQVNPSTSAKPTIRTAAKMRAVMPRNPVRPSSMAIGSSPTTGKFEYLEILDEISVPADHAGRFLLP
jgi:hypothetical protein